MCVCTHCRFIRDDLCDELRLLSLCGSETTVSNHGVLQQSLDHIWKSTFHKIPTDKMSKMSWLGGKKLREEHKQTEQQRPVVFQDQLDFPVAHCAQLKRQRQQQNKLQSVLLRITLKTLYHKIRNASKNKRARASVLLWGLYTHWVLNSIVPL